MLQIFHLSRLFSNYRKSEEKEKKKILKEAGDRGVGVERIFPVEQ